ncbi:MAG: cytochrome c family protein [Proteobacteria bacterium]|nr:cytochrome c family protein [Pseudomonadota bacterium]
MQRPEHIHLNLRTTAACTILLVAFASIAHAQSADEGRFQNNCAMCHSLSEGTHRMGPSLFRIIGRTAGTISGFPSSASYIEAGRNGVVWNAEALDVFLASPPRFLGQHASPPVTNRMSILIQNAETRERIIKFLIHRQNEGGEQ